MKYNFRNYETERRENLTQSWERKMPFSDVITNPRWRTDAMLKIVFFDYTSAPYWPINAKFGTEMKDHMPI